jgi:hypothetical protein
MEISEAEWNDLRAQMLAQKAWINAILIALLHKNVLTRADIDVLTESTLASIDLIEDPITEAVAEYVEHFRIACLPDE